MGKQEALAPAPRGQAQDTLAPAPQRAIQDEGPSANAGCQTQCLDLLPMLAPVLILDVNPDSGPSTDASSYADAEAIPQ
ncbi:hypothetical protein L0F63_005186 [Massospora cicadina]|nr:hypothetical protein L0F63_005186 [Massospora cicadina]